jgi:hypothetical protein
VPKVRKQISAITLDLKALMGTFDAIRKAQDRPSIAQEADDELTEIKRKIDTGEINSADPSLIDIFDEDDALRHGSDADRPA